jgi:hypothetical protein
LPDRSPEKPRKKSLKTMITIDGQIEIIRRGCDELLR